MAKPTPLTRSSTPNGYRAIAAVIQEWARIGRYQPGEQIPTEAELCASFNVARVTIRRALAVLVQDGTLEARHGAGTFIAAAYRAPPSQISVKLMGPRPGQWGDGVTYTFLREQTKTASPFEREGLKLTGANKLTEFAYLRLERNVPVEYTAFRFVDWAAELIEDRSESVLLHLSAYLAERGLRIGGMQRHVGATIASAPIAHLLDIQVGEALVLQRSIIRDQFDRPYLSLESLSRADKYTMELDITVGQKPNTHAPSHVGEVVGLWPKPKS